MAKKGMKRPSQDENNKGQIKKRKNNPPSVPEVK